MSEIVMPWDEDLESVLCVDFEISQLHSYAMQNGTRHDNPYAYATFSVGGYQHK